MNLLPFLAGNPVLLALIKWTALLGLGWIAHGLLRHAHPRWRLGLWRTLLVGGVLIGLSLFVPLPGLRVSLPASTDDHRSSTRNTGLTDVASPGHRLGTGSPSPDSSGTSATRLPASGLSDSAPNTGLDSGSAAARPPILLDATRARAFAMIWGLGTVLGLVRLVCIQARLRRIRQNARPAGTPLRQLAEAMGSRLGATCRLPNVRISGDIDSPLLCGLREPVILVPRRLESELSEAETSALLGHELAHFLRHDLHWNFGWRFMQALCWFHPLVWRAPAAHALACETEADRWTAATALAGSRQEYARCLATLALRTLGFHHPGHTLALEGGSQISRRLEQLAGKQPREWSKTHGVAAFALSALLLALTAGCDFNRSTSATRSPASGDVPAESNADTTSEHAFAEVTVVDENGQPIEGAEVLPFGFRVRGNDAQSAYGWDPVRFGPRVAAPTDARGIARIRYPVMAIPAEKQMTGALLLTVSHPRYGREERQYHPVDGSARPVRMRRGLSIRVTGFFGPGRQPVTELAPCLETDHKRRKDWVQESPGTLAFHQLSPGEHLIQFMGRLASGEIVYSESLSFRAEPGKEARFDLEMKPGLRIEGRLDARVPRPVKNGRVVVSVRPPQFPALTIPEEIGDLHKRFGPLQPWHSHRPIAEDGSFVFESVPPGELDLVCHGQGFVSTNGGIPRNRMSNGSIRAGLIIGVPQVFPLQAPVTRIDVITERTATLRLVATTLDGKPVAGARVVTSPNMMRLPGGLFAEPERSSEEVFRTLDPLPELPYETVTGQDGVAVLTDIPSCARGLDVIHPDLVVPLDPEMTDRWVRFKLTPGLTTEVAVKLVPKGTDFRGAMR